MDYTYEYVIGTDGKSHATDVIKRSDEAFIPLCGGTSEYNQYLIDTDGGLPLPEEQA